MSQDNENEGSNFTACFVVTLVQMIFADQSFLFCIVKYPLNKVEIEIELNVLSWIVLSIGKLLANFSESVISSFELGFSSK